jgi:hypothetical protein
MRQRTLSFRICHLVALTRRRLQSGVRQNRYPRLWRLQERRSGQFRREFLLPRVLHVGIPDAQLYMSPGYEAGAVWGHSIRMTLQDLGSIQRYFFRGIAPFSVATTY